MTDKIDATEIAIIKTNATKAFKEAWAKILVYTYDYVEDAAGEWVPDTTNPKDPTEAEYSQTIEDLSNTIMNAVIDALAAQINVEFPITDNSAGT